MANLQTVGGAANMRKGIPQAEDKVKIASWRTRPIDEIDLSYDEEGSPDGYGHAVVRLIEITCSGETNLAAAEAAGGSILSAAYGSNITAIINNQFSHAFTTGDVFNGIDATSLEFYLADIEYLGQRGEWEQFFATIHARPGVTHS